MRHALKRFLFWKYCTVASILSILEVSGLGEHRAEGERFTVNFLGATTTFILQRAMGNGR
jgi:hypothetical protein